MKEIVNLTVNGEIRQYETGRLPVNISSLLEELALPADMIVAEVNGDIVKRGEYAKHALSAGDTIELVRFVGGG
jgi:thiamine biosynthesis protein ThiS